MTAIVPSSQQPLVSKGGTITSPWLLFFNNLVTAPTAIQTVTLGATPAQFRAPAMGTVAVSGGTVSSITITRNTTTAATGVTAGLIPVAGNDVVTIAYSGLPTVSFIPG